MDTILHAIARGILCLFFVRFGVANGQAVIRDTLAVTFSVPGLQSPASGEKPHWKTLSYQFHPSGFCSATFEVWNDCGFHAIAANSGSSPAVVQIDLDITPLAEGPYHIAITRAGDYCGHRLVMYNDDGSVAWEDHCGSFSCHCALIGGFTASFYSDYSVSSMREICPGGSTSIQANPSMTPCLSGGWPVDGLITYSIIHGAEYGGLCRTDGEAVQTAITDLVRLLPYVRFNGNGRPALDGEDSVVVQVSPAGIASKNSSFRIIPISSGDLVLNITGGSVVAGDTAADHVRLPVSVGSTVPVSCPVSLNSFYVDFQIENTTYGHLVDPSGRIVSSPTLNHVLYAEAAAGRVCFVADGTIPENPVSISVTATFEGKVHGGGTITITHPPECVRLRPAKPSIVPGETVQFELRHRLYDGTFIPFPPEQRFDVYLTEGYGHGLLHGVNEDTASNNWQLSCTTNEFSFTSAESIEADTVHLEFRIVGAGERCSPGSTALDDCASPFASVILAKPFCVDITLVPDRLKAGDTADIILKKRYDNGTRVDFPAEQLFDASIVEGGSYGTLVSPDGSDTSDEMTAVHRGFRFCAGHSLDHDSVSIGIAVTVAGGGTVYEKSAGGKIVNASSGSECGLGKADLGLDLIITDPPLTGPNPDRVITADPPTMPPVSCRAILYGNVGDVVYDWTYRIRYGLPSRDADTVFTGRTYGFNESETVWDVPLEGKWWGGSVSISVNATNDCGTFSSERRDVYRIIGENPGMLACLGATRELRTIMSLESDFRQFETCTSCYENPANPVGYTLHGEDITGPGGYGLCQLTNPPPANAELWNWQLNRERGRCYFENQLMMIARNYPEQVRNKYFQNASDFSTDEELMKQTFLYYNRGPKYSYWKWEISPQNEAGAWIRNNESADTWIKNKIGILIGKCYADEAWYRFENNPCGGKIMN